MISKVDKWCWPKSQTVSLARIEISRSLTLSRWGEFQVWFKITSRKERDQCRWRRYSPQAGCHDPRGRDGWGGGWSVRSSCWESQIMKVRSWKPAADGGISFLPPPTSEAVRFASASLQTPAERRCAHISKVFQPNVCFTPLSAGLSATGSCPV